MQFCVPFSLEANCGSGFVPQNWDCTKLFIRCWLNFYQRIRVLKIAEGRRIG